MAVAQGSTAVTVLLALAGVAVLGGLGWWALGGDGAIAAAPLPAASASAPAPVDEAGLRALLRDPAVLERGKAVFAGLCFTCHGPHGEGGLGPNLRDDSWLTGSSQLTELVRTISAGRPGTAMQPMRNAYPPSDIAAVAAYIVTLKGGTAGIDKAPEGQHAPITYWP
jgi:mono/diheme cytochrome c family protein